MKKYTVEQLKEIVIEVTGWDGSLEEFDYMDMEELEEILNGLNPIEILRMSQFGNFNWNDDYFIINAYGNLDSVNEFRFEKMLEENHDEIVERYKELLDEGVIREI